MSEQNSEKPTNWHSMIAAVFAEMLALEIR
jgi:hypothetical protein